MIISAILNFYKIERIVIVPNIYFVGNGKIRSPKNAVNADKISIPKLEVFDEARTRFLGLLEIYDTIYIRYYAEKMQTGLCRNIKKRHF